MYSHPLTGRASAEEDAVKIIFPITIKEGYRLQDIAYFAFWETADKFHMTSPW